MDVQCILAYMMKYVTTVIIIYVLFVKRVTLAATSAKRGNGKEQFIYNILITE